MKRWLVNGTIVVYVSALFWGVFAHAMNFAVGSHPAMYFVVWDMFCGFSSYEKRQLVLGEGVSGAFYELDPPPWGEVKPFGPIGRRNYDVTGIYSVKFGMNTLRHTRHEPITRILVIEEYWSKKYNLPDSIWQTYFPEPKRPTLYRNVICNVLADGTPVEMRPTWLHELCARTLSSNPKVVRESYRAKPFFQYDLNISDQPENGSEAAYIKTLMTGGGRLTGL